MFNNSIKLIAHLTSSSLELIGEEVEGNEVAVFPEKLIENLNVKDPEKFKQSIIDFLAKSSLKKQKVLVVLGEGMLFEKIIKYTDKETVKKQADEFFGKIPFEKEHLAKTTLTNDKDVYLIATNKRLYEIVAEAFLAIGWKIDSVVPITLFGLPGKKITPENAKSILKNTSLIKLGNFLLENPIDFALFEKPQEVTIAKDEASKEKEGEEKPASPFLKVEASLEKEPNGKKKYLLYAAIAILVAILGFLLMTLRIVPNPVSLIGSKFAVSSPTPTKAPTPSPTPSPTPTATLKADLKIQVQNGSGTVGQAALVKKSLVGLGYANITTGNAATTDNTDTMVTFGANVGKDQKDEVVKSLDKTFKNVVTKTTTGTPSFDIVIITGQQS